VYTQPDRPAGRGRRLSASPVKQTAQRLGLAVEQPLSLRDAAVAGRLAALAPDVLVVAAYGLLLPQAVLDIPKAGCVNVHASLLPRWRGAAPVQRALLAGDPETGVSIMRMEAGLDTGPVLCTRRCPVAPADTTGSLAEKLARLGAELLVHCLDEWRHGRIEPQPQDERLATYAAKLSREEAELDWRRPALELERQVRALNPRPVAHTTWQDRALRVWEAEVVTAAPGLPGSVAAHGPAGIDVITGEGALRITRLQLAGGRVLSAAEFCNARNPAGARFGAPGTDARES